MADHVARVFSAAGVAPLRLREDGPGAWVSTDAVQLEPGDFIDFGIMGSFTLTLRSWTPPPGIAEMYTFDRPEGGSLDGL